MKKQFAITLLHLTILFQAQVYAQKLKLFVPAQANEWHTFLEKSGKNSDPLKVFDFTNEVLRVSGEEFGYVVTERSFKNFKLTLDFKWGEKKFPPRANERRDAGILYFVQNEKGDKIWPQSIEFQIQEGDCGDIWLVDNVSITANDTAFAPSAYKRIVKLKEAEKPKGQWNKAEVIVREGTITHLLNGEIVNKASNPSIFEGKIVLQSEGSEIFYRNVVVEIF